MSISDLAEATPSLRRLDHFTKRFDCNKLDRPVTVSALTRWIKNGISLGTGERIRLRAVRFPAGWRTCDEWVNEFLDRLTAVAINGARPPEPAATPPSAARKRRLEHAQTEAESLGL
jgi:hypothetical protein